MLMDRPVFAITQVIRSMNSVRRAGDGSIATLFVIDIQQSRFCVLKKDSSISLSCVLDQEKKPKRFQSLRSNERWDRFVHGPECSADDRSRVLGGSTKLERWSRVLLRETFATLKSTWFAWKTSCWWGLIISLGDTHLVATLSRPRKGRTPSCPETKCWTSEMLFIFRSRTCKSCKTRWYTETFRLRIYNKLPWRFLWKISILESLSCTSSKRHTYGNVLRVPTPHAMFHPENNQPCSKGSLNLVNLSYALSLPDFLLLNPGHCFFGPIIALSSWV